MNAFSSIGKAVGLLLMTPALAAAQSPATRDLAGTIRDVQQYETLPFTSWRCCWSGSVS